MTIKSILAWLSRPFTKGKTMTDTVDTTAGASALAATSDTSAQSAAVVTAALDAPAPAAVVVPAAVAANHPDVIEKLEAILAALGHELPVFWGEAVALAKKAA